MQWNQLIDSETLSSIEKPFAQKILPLSVLAPNLPNYFILFHATFQHARALVYRKCPLKHLILAENILNRIDTSCAFLTEYFFWR